MAADAIKCESSQLVLPNDHTYQPIAADFVSAVAKKFGFLETDCQKIATGIDAALGIIFEHAFEVGQTGSVTLSCERRPQGIKIVLHDKGIPFDYRRFVEELSDRRENKYSFKDFFDEVRFNNLGPGGKEIVLIKRLKTKSLGAYHDACILEPYKEPTSNGIANGGHKSSCRVKSLAPDDALEVVKSIYKTYGYSYPYEFVYYPEELLAMNAEGQIHSAVAYVGKNTVAGHAAIVYQKQNPKGAKGRIAELAMGVVRPEYRSLKCFSKMTTYLVEKAAKDGLDGLFTQPVTNHGWSQKTGRRLGFYDCAIRLGMIPAATNFRGIKAADKNPVSMLVQFHYGKKPKKMKVFAPAHHRQMISDIYSQMQTVVSLADIDPNWKVNGRSRYQLKINRAINSAVIEIERFGTQIVDEIRNELKALCNKNIRTVSLFLDLGLKETSIITAALESIGFFFAGLLPAAFENGDALILQYLNNVEIDYEKICIESSFSQNILKYIYKRDPNN